RVFAQLMTAFSGEVEKRCSTYGDFNGDLYWDEISIACALRLIFSRWLKPISGSVLAGGLDAQPPINKAGTNIKVAINAEYLDFIKSTMALVGHIFKHQGKVFLDQHH
ncbi:MAG: hypothetical protein KAR80_04990, partial [Rhodospirillaceae bacterium]|nr:hypothetical protein [Rhodospirillaceae bacterium]